MNYIQIDKSSISNGLGVRVVLWISGCTIHCDGCQNPETWNFTTGFTFDKDTKNKLFELLGKEWIKGITISGGNPLEYKNLPDLYDLIQDLKEHFPDKDIWLYTGYELTIKDFDTNVESEWDNKFLKNYILSMCNVVIDGPYIESQRDITLPFKGSTNQRLIDVKKTLKQNKIILLEDC